MWSSTAATDYPTLRANYHSYPGGSDTTWSQHSGTKGRSQLWSALLVLMVCIVTLAVLAVVALALVLGGHAMTKKSSSDSKPSATWGEEIEDTIKYSDLSQRQIILQTVKPPAPPPPPPQIQQLPSSTQKASTTSKVTPPRRLVVPSSTTSTMRTTTTRSAVPSTTSGRPLPLNRQPMNTEAVTPPPYNVKGGVDFSRIKEKEEEKWTPIAEEEFVVQREPVGEAAVVTTLQEVIDADHMSKLPSRSYSGLGALRPMPTLFPAKKPDAPAPSSTTTTTTTSTPTPSTGTVVDSPFFEESLSSMTTPKQKISATYKSEEMEKEMPSVLITNTHLTVKETDRQLQEVPSPSSFVKMGGALSDLSPMSLIPTNSEEEEEVIRVNNSSFPVYIVHATEKTSEPIFTIEMGEEEDQGLETTPAYEETETEAFTEIDELATTLVPQEETGAPPSPSEAPTKGVGPTLSSLLLKPLTASQRTAEVDSASSPLKAGLLYREPKSGPANTKESLVQGFPKNEFNSVPAFLRRNNTLSKKTTTFLPTTGAPTTTVQPISINCTCAERLRAQGLGRKLCDGVVDCWDFSDETACEWCREGDYVCVHSRACIPKKKVCDGQRDCPFGDDERTCVSIAPDTRRADSLQYHDDGVLMVQQRGEWGPLCIEKLDGSAWRLGDVARAVCRALTYSDFDLAEQVVDPTSKGPFFELNFERNGSRGSTPRLAVMSSECPSKAAVRLGCSDLQCGVRPLAVSQWARKVRRSSSRGRFRGSRIVGGGNAGPGAWPWQAALYKEGQFQCGGSLVAAQWLLSASHCFAHNLDAYWVARLGALRRGTDLPSPFEQLRRITRIVQHPGYLDTGFINDLALLKMERPVDFSDYVRPVCLPPPTPPSLPSNATTPPPPAEEDKESNSPIESGQMCTVVGWGQLSEVGRIFPDTLQEVQLPLIPTEECRRRTLFLPLYRVTDDMFCAGFDRGGRDACLGDSGGPLMCQRPDGHWQLTGITSNGYGCARAHRPGVYTKVANYVPWINAVLSASAAATSLEEQKSERRAPACPSGQRRCALGQCMVPPPAGRCDRDFCPAA